MRKVYINNHYCPQAIADDLFGDILSENYFKYTFKITCWNKITYKLVHADLDKWEFYFKIDE